MDEINPTVSHTFIIIVQLYDNLELSVFPHHIIPKIAALNISGIDVPKNLGGRGLSTVDACACMYELARKDASVATFYLLHHSLGLYTI